MGCRRMRRAAHWAAGKRGYGVGIVDSTDLMHLRFGSTRYVIVRSPPPGLPFAIDGSFFAAFLAQQAAAAAPAAPVVVAAETAPAVAVKPAVILKRSAPPVVVRPQAAGEAAPMASDASKRAPQPSSPRALPPADSLRTTRKRWRRAGLSPVKRREVLPVLSAKHNYRPTRSSQDGARSARPHCRSRLLA